MLTFGVNYSMPRGYKRVRGVCEYLHWYPMNPDRGRKIKRRAGVLGKTCLRIPRSYIVGGVKKFRMDDSGELLKSAVNRQPGYRRGGTCRTEWCVWYVYISYELHLTVWRCYGLLDKIYNDDSVMNSAYVYKIMRVYSVNTPSKRAILQKRKRDRWC